VPEGNERLVKLETRMDVFERGFDNHQESCERFRGEMREAVVGIKVAVAKYSGLAVIVMAAVVAIVQIVIQGVVGK